MRPLISGEPKSPSSPDRPSRVQLPFVRVATYDENEETTCVDEAILLKTSHSKQWLVAPVISLFTLFIWPVFLYWSKPM